MFRYLRSAPQVLRSCLAPSRRRLSRKEEFLRPLQLERLEDRSLLAGINLNDAINSLLSDPFNPPSPSQEFTYADITVGTSVGSGTADIEIKNVTLKFPDLAFEAGQWTGNVTVAAQTGVLFPGLLDIAVTDDGTDIDEGNDVDEYGVVGNISLSVGTSRLALDDIDGEEIGIPAFLDIQFTSLALNFTDFRGNDNANTLDAGIDFVGLDTGVDKLNELMASDNPLFQLTLEGHAETSWDLAAIEGSVATSNDIVSAFQEELAAEVGIDLQQGLSLKVSGKIFHVGDITGAATYHTITVDPDGIGPLSEQTSGYVAVQGSFRLANEELGGRGPKFELAFAISDLGPLQFYITKSPTESAPDADPPPPGTIVVESASFGVIFSKTIEQLQSGIDFSANAATTPVAAGNKFSVTLTIQDPDHDLEAGDSFAIVQANLSPNYIGEYEVESVVGDKVTFLMDTNPGTFAGSASIIRRTIKDPLDLRDDGLRTGISIPGSIFDWNNQLDASVHALLVSGDDHWAQMFENMVIGGGATLSISDIPDTVLLMDVNMYLDTHLRAMMQGNLILVDGAVQVPASLYGDLSDLFEGDGRFLFLADVGQVDLLLDDPLVTLRGEASFEVIENGFQIALEGGVDLNIPKATTITLEGESTLAFFSPSTGPDLQIDLGFDAALSETNVGDIAAARGMFHLAIDVLNSQQQPAEIWGAALLTTQFNFLNNVGLYADASAVLRVNSSNNDKLPEVLKDASENEIQVALPKESFALRLDGSVDFRIDFNGNDVFAVTESVAKLDGAFVLEFSTDGFNAALFDDSSGTVRPASIAIGPSGSRLMTFGVLGFLGIRLDGIAADLVLTAKASLPLGLGSLDAAAVFIVNTTGNVVTFNIPGGLDPSRSSQGLSVTIPKAAPSNPASILKAPDKDGTASGLNSLINGSPSWTEGSVGPYAVVFVAGKLDFLKVLKFDVSGYFLLSPDVISLEANFYAGANFLELASGSVSGHLFFSSQGEFELIADGKAQLGPDGFNINGTAHLAISYLDSDLKGSVGTGSKKLSVTGLLSVGAEVFYVDMGHLDLGVNYKEPSITVSVGGIPVPDIAWSAPDPLFGVSWPYPTIVIKSYDFTVGTLTVDPQLPPEPVLASRDANGVLTLNAGPKSRRDLRLISGDVRDEVVTIKSGGAGTVSGQKIQITMFGVTKEYDNVTSISADMDDGDDTVDIVDGVTVPIVVHLGVGADILTNRSVASLTAYGDGGRDQLKGGRGVDNLYGGDDGDNINGGTGADLIEGGAGSDFLIGGDGADTIRGGGGEDLIAGDLAEFKPIFANEAKTILVSTEFASKESANGGSDSIEGGDGDDIIFGGSGADNITGNAGNDLLFGGDGKATFTTTALTTTVDVVGLSSSLDANDTLTWAVGDGNDIIDGQASATDTLNIFGTDGSAEQVIVSAKGAGFTAAVGTESLSVDGVEISNIVGRGGSDSFTVNDLTGSVLQQINLQLGSDNVQDAVVVNGSASSDVFTISTFGSALRVQKTVGVTIDVFDISSTSGGDTITLDTKAGADTINVRVSLVGTLTTVNGGDGNDLIQVGSNATAATNTGGNLNGIAGGLTIAGDGGLDELSLDDTGDTTANTGTLTATQITGLGMGSTGITYAGVETLVVSLGSGDDTFTVQNTAGTANTINTGNGSDNVTVNATGSGSLILNGQADADTFNINLGSLAATVSVSDSGASGSDALNINGIAGANNIVLDYATITSGTELVNYTGIESLRIDTHDEADAFMIKDNGARTTIYSGIGDDEFTIGPAVNEDGEVVDANLNGTNTDEQAIKGTSLWMTINGGDGNDDFEVNRNTGELFLNGENGNDVFVLNTLITGGDSTVDGGGDTDVITYLQNAPVHINGGNGFDTIIVNGSKLDDFFIITGTTIEVVGSRKVDYVEIESLTANGRKGMDTFTVDTTIDGLGNPLATSALQMLMVNGQQDDDLMELRGMLADIVSTFSGGLGNDTFNLKSLVPLTVNAIDGPVTINGDDGQDSLNVVDTGDAIADTGSLSATSLTGLGMDAGVTYGTMEGLNISLGSGGNTFTILDTHTGSTVLNSGSGADTVHVRRIHGTTTVNAEARNDSINVGCLAPSGSSVNQIASALIVNGGGDNLDTLNVDDTGDANPNSGCLTATTLTGLGMGVGITYSNLEVLNVSLGAGGNSFSVKSTAAGTATTLNSGNGDDILTIDSNGASANGTVNCVVSSLTINGQGGFSVLTMEDYSDSTGDKVHVTPTQIGAATGDTFFGTGGFLTYSDLDQVTLNMSQAYLPDTIDLTPSRLGTEFFIRGRDPQTPMQRAQLNGDVLYQDFTGLTAAERLGVSLKATGLNNPADPVFNVWNIPGHGRVNYKQIEKMNHVQTLAVASDIGGSAPRVKVIDAETGLVKHNFLAFDAGFKGGVRVAVGDVNGDAIPDIITSAGPGVGPKVRVFNGATGVRFTGAMGEFFAFPAGSKTSVQVAVGDINLDGLADIITGSDSGGEPIVKVFDAYKLLTGQANPVVSQFFAYDRNFAGGVRLAVGDLNGDGVLDIATGPGAGLNSQVRIFKTNLSTNQATVAHTLIASFSAFPNYNGGVHLAVGDVTGDGRADLVVGTASGGTAMTRIYNGATIGSGSPPALLANFKPYGTQAGGVRVALVDLDGDGVNELITASALTGSKVKPKAFRLQPTGPSALTPAAIDSYFAGYASDPFFQGALFLGGGN